MNKLPICLPFLTYESKITLVKSKKIFLLSFYLQFDTIGKEP